MTGFNVSSLAGNLMVNREGQRISVSSPPNGLRQVPKTSLNIDFGEDTVTIRGRKDNQAIAFDIHMSPDQITVKEPSNPMLRRLSNGTTFQPAQPLDPKNYGQIGLEVASSVVGLPLSLLLEPKE